MLDVTCVVQVLLQPTFGALVIKLSSTRHEEQQVVPESSRIHKWAQNKVDEGGCVMWGDNGLEGGFQSKALYLMQV